MNTMLILDVETTGISPATAGIVEVGAILLDDRGEEISSFSQLAWPGFERINTESHWKALQISGISPAELLDAEPVWQVIMRLNHWLDTLDHFSPWPVTSYNVGFDRGFLDAALSDPQFTDPRWREAFDWRDCIMERMKRHLGLTRWPSLARACELLGVERSGGHRALADARAASCLWQRMEGK